LIFRKFAAASAAIVRLHDYGSSDTPRRGGGRATGHADWDMTMSIIFRLLFIIAGAVTALFVARDALNFTIIQTFVAILLVTAIVGVGSLWSLRRKT
jgi:hypothetical protein